MGGAIVRLSIIAPHVQSRKLLSREGLLLSERNLSHPEAFCTSPTKSGEDHVHPKEFAALNPIARSTHGASNSEQSFNHSHLPFSDSDRRIQHLTDYPVNHPSL